MPILLYGAEVWGPYMEYDSSSWEKSKIERVQTQFLKRVLGCSIQTSNNMVRGEVGIRPLLVNTLTRVISYIKSIKNRAESTVHTAYLFEKNNVTSPNFCTFMSKFDMDVEELCDKSKTEVKTLCNSNYDRYWSSALNESPKAESYILFKTNLCFEKYLYVIKNSRHRKSLSRFRISNHELLIEKGRHMRPRLERLDRKCFICKTEVEDEKHFLVKCPLYENQRDSLYQTCRQNCQIFDTLPSEESKFIYIMTNENEHVMRDVAKFVCDAFEFRKIALD